MTVEDETLELYERAVRDFAQAVAVGAFDCAERALRIALAMSIVRPTVLEEAPGVS